jgi:branched-chain amino acid transport system substrate-binding protein
MKTVGFVLAGVLALAVGTGAEVGARSASASHGSAIRIGALYPLSGSQASGGREEYQGLQTAVSLINASGGVLGRSISFVTANAPSADAAPDAVDRLKRLGVSIVTGSYGSTISLPASAEAQRDGLIFWESGAVATMVTERGYSNVFRTVTTGNSLGRAGARYAASIIAPRLHVTAPRLRSAVVYAGDVYGSSVGRAMVAEAKSLHFRLAGVLSYDPYRVSFPPLVRRLKDMRPDIVLVAGYVQDAIAFRRETLRQHLHPAAMIGTSSASARPCFHSVSTELQGEHDRAGGGGLRRRLDSVPRCPTARAVAESGRCPRCRSESELTLRFRDQRGGGSIRPTGSARRRAKSPGHQRDLAVAASGA